MTQATTDLAGKRTPPRRGQARIAIIEAAAALARQEGLAGLSVDKVALQAGVSKGAFFHHFPTRRDMVVALIGHMAESFDADLASRSATGRSFARALVEATFAAVERDPSFLTTLVTSVALDWSLGPEVLARTDVFARRMIDEGVPASTTALLRAALDGLLQHCLLRADTKPNPQFVEQAREGFERLLNAEGL